MLPDGVADIVWARGALSVAGPATGPSDPQLAPGTPVMGVRFRVGAAGAALQLPADELRDATVPVADLWGAAAAEAIEERIAASDDPLAALLAAVALRVATTPLDAAVRAGAVASGQGARIGALAGELGLSERQLRRRFATAVGYGPKMLARVLRLQRMLTLAAGGRRDLAALALDAGWADQAHMGNDVRRLTGASPGALLASGAGPAGEPGVLRG